MISFTRFDYRTRDLAAARAFYDALLGPTELRFVTLPEAARSVPSHWLGYLGVDDVARVAAAFVEHGATRLSPPHATEVVLRDRGGALVGLTHGVARANDPVAWWHLETRDVGHASASYGELLGWSVRASSDSEQVPGLREFALHPGGDSVGTMRPCGADHHPQWLVQFHTAAFEDACGAVRALGGVVLDVITLPNRPRIAICDDVLGAGFALREGVRPSR